MFPDERLLRTALRTNAVFSGLTALVVALAADPVGEVLGSVSPGVLHLVAGGLGLFTADLAHQLFAERLNPLRALGATVGDLLWVAGSAGILIVRPDVLSRTGVVVVGAVAALVLAIAGLQLLGLRRFARNRRGETGEPSMFLLTRVLDAPADRVWDLLRSLGRIGEVLEIDDRDRSLSLRFVTEADDFPFPMTTMVGGWEVAPLGHQCEVTLWYEFSLGRGMVGEVLAALAAPALDRRMGSVVEELEAVVAASGDGEARIPAGSA
ncbi:MAG: hypothetical protein GWN85_43795 [Gemmatimonadetes bacterium]|nr:hypothetical protein [Gemmatimonadota bacterium]NIW63735.1 hypothetical protein [Gemmatimonadota bacterium]